MIRTLVSIHDVMPGTLGAVTEQLRLLRRHGIERVTLLVVPGLDWPNPAVTQLHGWLKAGHELAGHGWKHRVREVSGFYHRLYSALISRRAAEHLALSAEGIHGLLQDNVAWFRQRGLPRPGLYVPPAWAVGALALEEYGRLGFAQVETLRGVYDTRSGRLQVIPAMGFEASDRGRALALRVSNAVNGVLARGSGLLRLGLHPGDLELHLARDVHRRIAGVGPTLLYRELAEENRRRSRADAA